MFSANKWSSFWILNFPMSPWRRAAEHQRAFVSEQFTTTAQFFYSRQHTNDPAKCWPPTQPPTLLPARAYDVLAKFQNEIFKLLNNSQFSILQDCWGFWKCPNWTFAFKQSGSCPQLQDKKNHTIQDENLFLAINNAMVTSSNYPRN